MKKLILLSLFVVLLYTSAVRPASALVVECPLCSKLATQLQELAKDIGILDASRFGAYQQYLQTTNDLVLKPAKDALTLVMIINSGQQVQNLVLGSLGTERLLVTNPEQYIQSRASNVVRVSVGDISGSNGIYSNSILNSVVNQYKYENTDLSSKLRSLTQSSVPSTVQNNICADAKLSSLAYNDVKDEEGNYDESVYRARKKEIYDALCVGNPSTNPQLAKKLDGAYNQDPNLGGWDAWLAITMGGQNDYAKSEAVKAEIAKEVARKEEAAKAELAAGGGLKNKTKCDQSAYVDENGEPYLDEENNPVTPPSNIPCAQETVTKLSGTLQNLWNDALSSPLRTLQASIGTGAGSLLSTAFQTGSLLLQINTALGNINGDDDRALGAGTTNAAYTQDLTNDPEKKETLLAPIRKQFNVHLEALTKLETANRSFIGAINVNNTQLANMKACFVSLVGDFTRPASTSTDAEGNIITIPASSASSDPRVASAFSYHDAGKSNNATQLTKVNKELTDVATSRTIIGNALSSMQTTNSSGEILRLFTKYQGDFDSQGLPNVMSGTQREDELSDYTYKNKQSLEEGGELYSFNKTCADMRTEMQSATTQY
jgi:hypothetical protein